MCWSPRRRWRRSASWRTSSASGARGCRRWRWRALTGVSNSDGAAFMVLALYLLVAGRLGLAGLALGLLPWVRYECALFSTLFAAYVVLGRRDRRFLAGLAAWPVLYLGAGAIY